MRKDEDLFQDLLREGRASFEQECERMEARRAELDAMEKLLEEMDAIRKGAVYPPPEKLNGFYDISGVG